MSTCPAPNRYIYLESRVAGRCRVYVHVAGLSPVERDGATLPAARAKAFDAVAEEAEERGVTVDFDSLDLDHVHFLPEEVLS